MFERFFSILLMLLAAQVCAAADDTIFPGNTAPASELRELPRISVTIPETPPVKELPKWWKNGSRIFSEMVRKFMFSLIASQGGLEHPSPDESPNDIFSQRLGTSRLKFLLQGAGNLRLLNGPYVSSQIQGGVGVEYDFVLPDSTDHSTLVAVRFSPVYGEIVMVDMPLGSLFENTLPRGFFVGSSLGVEVSKRYGQFEPGFRAYTRTEWGSFENNLPALSYYAAVYCRIHIKDLFSSAVSQP